MSAARSKQRFLFHGRDETTQDDGSAIATADSLGFARVGGRVDPSHSTPSHRNANNRDDSSKNIARQPSHWPVILFIPNLLGYIRILLALHGMKHSIQLHYNKALNTWIAASLLDLIDGIAARKLNQCSHFGILLDIIADNILRTVVWISCMILVSSKGNDGANGGANVIVVWTTIICLEWITMFCSQQNQSSRTEEEARSDHHWKDVKRKGNEATSSQNPPFWVQAVFHNNFRSPFGILAVYGLFVAPLGTYVGYASDASTSNNETWPTQILSAQMISILVLIAYIGRTLSAAVELWLCWKYLGGVIVRDSCGGKRMS